MFDGVNYLLVEDIIDKALREDIGSGDLTSGALFKPEEITKAAITAKEAGVIAGLPLLSLVFGKLDPGVTVNLTTREGCPVANGEKVAVIRGPVVAILSGERVALNFLQRLSGIATRTSSFVKLVSDYEVRIADTRKTTPGLRLLEKYAVRAGRGTNHRFGLYDAVLLKDNHLKAAGGITPAVQKVRQSISFTTKIEVEASTLSQVEEALTCRVDLIMLDNMSPSVMKEAVSLRGSQNVLLEASGNIGEDSVQQVASTGVDIISVGALTHSVRSLDVSLNMEDS